MYCKMSEMNHRITIQRPKTQTDSEGNIITESSPDLVDVWAKILPSSSKNYEGSQEKVQEIIYKIVVRKAVDVKVTDKILWGEKILEIIAPPYMLDGKRTFKIVEARELVE